MILQAIIECGSPEACAEIARVQYETVTLLLYLTLYFSMGVLTVKVINDMSYNIFDQLVIFGVSKRIIFIVKFFLYTTWPILCVAFMYGFIRSKIEAIKK